MQIPRLHKETSLFDRAKSIAATFDVLADSITSVVQGEATYDAPDGTVKTSPIGTMVRQTVGNVLIRATSGDTTAAQGGQHLIQSLINVAPEGVRIAASKLEITGAAVFGAINGDTGTTKIDGGKIDATSITIGQSQVTGLTSALDGKVTAVDVEYAHNQSTTTPPTSGWSDTCPAWQEGWHIWQRTATTAGGTTTYSDPACISGREPKDGVTVSAVEYAVGTGTTPPSSGWGTSIPSVSQGQWLWTRVTYSDGSTALSPAYQGTNGADGTSVTILGSYNTLAELQAAHPTGSLGDAYMVGGDLYVWDGTRWTDVGQIQGPQGPAGADGTSVTVASVAYGISSSASAQPTNWSQTAPTSIAGGSWLWVKTTYSDSTETVTKSYVGTDGQDGRSVYVQSATKVGDTTTVVISDGTTQTTLTITDGQDGANGRDGTDGANGTDGADGQSAYVHIAWANSADGSQGFSPTVSTGKTYIGVYTDNIAADSTTPSDYSWSLIKGADGTSVTVSRIEYGTSASASTAPSAWRTTPPTSITKGQWLWVRTTYNTGSTTTTKSYVGTDGEDGTGITSIVEQYYLSTSDEEPTDGSWSSEQPAWVEGRYIWTRSQITWDTTPATVTTTTPVLAQALNGANGTAAQALEDAANAAKTATSYVTEVTGDGIWVTPEDAKPVNGVAAATTSGWHIADALELFRSGASVFKVWVESSVTKVRVGIANGRHLLMDDSSISLFNVSTLMARIEQVTNMTDITGRLAFHDGAYVHGGNKRGYSSTVEVTAEHCQDDDTSRYGHDAFVSMRSWKDLTGDNYHSSVTLKGDVLGLADSDHSIITVPMQRALNHLRGGDVLFSGSYSSTYNSAITGLPDLTDYARLLVEYEDSTGRRGSVWVDPPTNGTLVGTIFGCTTTGGNSASGLVIRSKSYKIAATSIDTDKDNNNRYTYGKVTVSTSGGVTYANSQEIGIVRIIGYR